MARRASKISDRFEGECITLKAFLKKVLYAVGANLLSLVVSVLTTLIVPKFFGDAVEQYGYLQIYLFYVGYIGFFHLGWCDGIFLRDGGKRWDELDKPLYAGQFWLLSLLQLIIAAMIAICGYIFSPDADYRFICFAIGINVLIYLPRTMLAYYLQTTNRIKEYSSITTIGRTIYGVSIIVTVLFLSKSYKHFVIGDIIGKTIALFVSILWCKDIVIKTKPSPIKITFREAKINISVGIKLLFANIASMLVTGIVQWGIQTKWDVATYGKISFTLSVSNLLLVFISAVALVLYPTLRRTNQDNLTGIYNILRNVLMVPMLGCLVVYYPVELILSHWLPQYAESMHYMAILFPMCIYAAKNTLLINTYLNVCRMEKKTFLINVIGVAVAAVTTAISVFVLQNLTLAMMTIVVNQMFRCILGEFILSKRMNVSVVKDNILEAVLTVLFISVNWFVGGWIGVALYFAGYVIYLVMKYNDIKDTFHELKLLRKRNTEKPNGTD